MSNLKRAHEQLYRRGPDETFASLADVRQFCQRQREQSVDVWQTASGLIPQTDEAGLRLAVGTDGAFALNHWSFSQLCSLCGVSKDTINRLSPETARRALQETLPARSKPLQLLLNHETVRSIHGTHYARLWNVELLDAVQDAAPDFTPPQRAASGGTGLYAGEQDCFVFLIDPAGWAEIGDEVFAPGLFAWNSEVGRRSFGVQTFWFQSCCANHIVWDAVDTVDLKKRHTGNVAESLGEVRRCVAKLVAQRNERRDGFARVIAKAMQAQVGDSDEAAKFLTSHGISRGLVKRAVAKIGEAGSPFTIFTLVDALTQLSQDVGYAGDRTEADATASKLLALAA